MKPFRIMILSIFLSALCFAQTHYASQVIKTYSNKLENKASGKVLPSTSLEIIKKDGNKALVKITGWNQNAVSRIVYFSKGKRIISAVFAKNAKYELKKLGHKTIIDEKSWEKVSITTWIENKGLKDNIKVLYKKAKNLYQTNCSMCHPTPDINHFNANQWPAIIKSMASNTALNKNEQLLITQYLQKNTNKK